MQILQVCGDGDRLRILEFLRASPATQKALAAELKINSGTLSRHMALLEAVGLVIRDRSHSPFVLAAPEATRQLLLATTDLNLEISRAKTEALERRREGLANVETPATRSTDQVDSG
ncbi:MAG TPA: winged helix-turn-helix domain-containing protein [Solirubrobacteraceae bacterium]|nr:winged helix-turn-helix domain-containing protein [Solirubrobacteraceae bacterium]